MVTTVNVAAAPVTTDRLAGWLVIVGAASIVPDKTASVLLVTLSYLFVLSLETREPEIVPVGI